MNNIIEITSLRKSYGEIKAVKDVSLSVNKGEMFGLVGPDGAGKTTTIKMLTTLLNPTSGKISIDGLDPVKDQDKVRKSFGIVFQDPSLDDELTACENMDFHGVLYHVPAVLRKQRIEELLKFVELWEKRNDLVKTFSGGMRRRLEIARGLLHTPGILFLDEPTIGLDPQTRNHIWTYIKELNNTKNITVFFTTHYMDEAERVAQKIAIMDHGKIITQGTLDELKDQTKTDSLENAFLKLTGDVIREEEAGAVDIMRMRRKAMGKQ